MFEDFGSFEELIAGSHLDERQVRLALAYRETFPEEVDAAVAENRLPPEKWRELYPFEFAAIVAGVNHILELYPAQRQWRDLVVGL